MTSGGSEEWVTSGPTTASTTNRKHLVEVLQGGRSVEDSPSPERVAAVRCDYVQGSARDGVGVDGEW